MTPTELSDKAGISLGYASMLLSGERDSCSLSMSLQIYDRTGLKFGVLKGLEADTIEHLRPKSQDKAA